MADEEFDGENDDEASAEPLDAAVEGHAELTLNDFKGVWPSLPQVRSLIGLFVLWSVAPPVFIFLSVLATHNFGVELLRSPYLLWVVLGPCLFAFILWSTRKNWSRTALNDLRGAEGVTFRFDAGGASMAAPGAPFS